MPPSSTRGHRDRMHRTALARVTGPETLARWAPRLVAVVAVAALVSGFSRPLRGRLEVLRDVLPVTTPAIAIAATVAAGFVLLVLLGRLRRRTVAAWWASTLMVAAVEVLHLAKGLDVEEVLVGIPALVILLRARPAFTARRDARSWGRTGLVAAAAIAGAWLSALTVVALSRGPVVVVVSALRPRTAPPAMAPAELATARELLHRPDADSLGWFALRDDRSIVLEPSSRAAVSDRVVSGVALAAGDPLGDPRPARRPGTTQGWTPGSSATRP